MRKKELKGHSKILGFAEKGFRFKVDDIVLM